MVNERQSPEAITLNKCRLCQKRCDRNH